MLNGDIGNYKIGVYRDDVNLAVLLICAPTRFACNIYIVALKAFDGLAIPNEVSVRLVGHSAPPVQLSRNYTPVDCG